MEKKKEIDQSSFQKRTLTEEEMKNLQVVSGSVGCGEDCSSSKDCTKECPICGWFKIHEFGKCVQKIEDIK